MVSGNQFLKLRMTIHIYTKYLLNVCICINLRTYYTKIKGYMYVYTKLNNCLFVYNALDLSSTKIF